MTEPTSDNVSKLERLLAENNIKVTPFNEESNVAGCAPPQTFVCTPSNTVICLPGTCTRSIIIVTME